MVQRFYYTIVLRFRKYHYFQVLQILTKPLNGYNQTAKKVWRTLLDDDIISVLGQLFVVASISRLGSVPGLWVWPHHKY